MKPFPDGSHIIFLSRSQTFECRCPCSYDTYICVTSARASARFMQMHTLCMDHVSSVLFFLFFQLLVLFPNLGRKNLLITFLKTEHRPQAKTRSPMHYFDFLGLGKGFTFDMIRLCRLTWPTTWGSEPPLRRFHAAWRRCAVGDSSHHRNIHMGNPGGGNVPYLSYVTTSQCGNATFLTTWSM